MKSNTNILSALILFCALLPASAKVKVATSLPDLASIAAYVGGDQVEVFSVSKANANPHLVEVLPSYMIQVSRAAIYLKAGLGLDPWAEDIIEGARNSKLLVLDCSARIEVLDKPTGKVDASRGDVHPLGNPHYWLDPQNGIDIAETIRDALQKADPSHAAMYEANTARFKAEIEKRNQAWKEKMKSLKGAPIITYHTSWAYLAHAFDLRIVGYVEPYPGIPPTARHLQGLVDNIKAVKAGILIQEPFYQAKDPQFLARQTGIKVFRFTPSCAGTGALEYFNHFDAIVNELSGVKP